MEPLRPLWWRALAALGINVDKDYQRSRNQGSRRIEHCKVYKAVVADVKILVDAEAEGKKRAKVETAVKKGKPQRKPKM